ncbi:MAG: hypothetical protein EOP56_03535 [Sphingobacteriales bacterium]|nr:MAG: hypothetical protein EOP56_03535 [Sphingobacteriales bacterium]
MVVKNTKAKTNQPIQYEEIDGIKYLLLSKDYSKVQKGIVPLTDKCAFCGKEHLHSGAIEGLRRAQCRKHATCTADDGSILYSSDGYIIVNRNKD